ncbi:MAG TPA: DUF5655 domain-containing protein [Cyclobacteriaceae bacterium]|nr:DUF5655 domain-containing protein [Cyclobacteriaceae bacterium]
MPLFELDKEKLKAIHEEPFKLEKDIQRVVENNLERLFAIRLVKSEFTIKNKRIDTLAFDEQSGGFVIIEYKRDRNFTVIDQGFAYLSLMLENRGEFIVEYNESLGGELKRDDVDWSQSRVIFVAPDFTENQKLASNFKDAAIELWEIKRYQGGIIGINPVKKTSNESIKQLASRNSEIAEVASEIKVYAEEDHFVNASDVTRQLYEDIKARILNLNGLTIAPTKLYISFKLDGRIITDFSLQKKLIVQRINLKEGQLDDPRGLFDAIPNKGHWGVGDYQGRYDENVDLDYLMSLVVQSYNFHRKSN